MAPPTASSSTPDQLTFQYGTQQIYLPVSISYPNAVNLLRLKFSLPPHSTIILRLSEGDLLGEGNWQRVVKASGVPSVISVEAASELASLLGCLDCGEQDAPPLSQCSTSPNPRAGPSSSILLPTASTTSDPPISFQSHPLSGHPIDTSLHRITNFSGPMTPPSPNLTCPTPSSSNDSQAFSAASNSSGLPIEANTRRNVRRSINGPLSSTSRSATYLPIGSSDSITSPKWETAAESTPPQDRSSHTCDNPSGASPTTSLPPSPAGSPPPLTASESSSGASTPSSLGSPHPLELPPLAALEVQTPDGMIDGFPAFGQDASGSACLPGTIQAEDQRTQLPDRPHVANLRAWQTPQSHPILAALPGVPPEHVLSPLANAPAPRQPETPEWGWNLGLAPAAPSTRSAGTSVEVSEEGYSRAGSSASGSVSGPLIITVRSSPARGEASQNTQELLGPSAQRIPSLSFDSDESYDTSAPPPYTSRHQTENNRRVTFVVSIPTGESIHLSAKRSIRLSKALESACAIFKLQPSKCRLYYEGRTFGHGDIARLTLGSLDIREGDQLGITWDDVVAHSDLYLQSINPLPQEDEENMEASYSHSITQARATVTLTPRWTFDGLSPLAPVDLVAGHADQDTRPKVVWNLRTRTDGMLAVHGETRPVKCIRWESQVKPSLINSPLGRLPTAPRVSPLHTERRSISPFNPEPGDDPPDPIFTSQPSALIPILPDNNLQALRELIVRLIAVVLNILASLLAKPEHVPPYDNGSSSRPLALPSGLAGISPLVTDGGPFNPIEASEVFRDNNCIVLDSGSVGLYVLDVLKELGVPKEVRRGWTTQRLPLIVRHKWVAIRFLSKPSLMECSTLRITPEPDQVIRAFMVFMGIPTDDLAQWNVAKERGRRSTVNRRHGTERCGKEWKKIILGTDAVQDEMGLDGFKVYELGWMEVLP